MTTFIRPIEEELEHAASRYLSAAVGLFRAVKRLADEIDGCDGPGNLSVADEIFAIAESGALLAEKGLGDVEVIGRAHRVAAQPVQGAEPAAD